MPARTISMGLWAKLAKHQLGRVSDVTSTVWGTAQLATCKGNEGNDAWY